MTEHLLNTIHDDLGSALKRIASGHPILLKCGDTDLGALVSVEDLRLLEHYIEELECGVDLVEARKSLEEADREGTQPYETVRRDLGL
jgi:hypothetical protein